MSTHTLTNDGIMSLWAYLLSHFPDVQYIKTPFWPFYSQQQIRSFLTYLPKSNTISLYDLDKDDQEHIKELTLSLKKGMQGDADPTPALAQEYLCLTNQTYEEHALDYQQAIVQHNPLDIMLDKFAHLTSADGTIVDAGCGPGQDILKFRALGKNVIGIDASHSMVLLAKKLTKVPVYQMDLRSITLQSGSIEGIWCVATLLHLLRQDVQPVLQSFNRILKSQGYLFLSVKQGTGSNLIKRKKTGESPRFFTYFTREELLQYLSDARFETCDLARYATYRQGIGWDVWINILARKRD